jgi:hypothetical protein
MSLEKKRMRVLVGQREHAVAGDDSINDLKARIGPVYLCAKKRQWVTSRAIMGPAASISRAELQATLANLGAPRTLVAAHYSFDDLLTLNLDGEHDVWVALGQTMPAHVSVNPRFYRATEQVAAPDLHRLLLDYLPLVDDTVYGWPLADLPNARVYLTAAEPALRQEGARIAPTQVLVRAVKCLLPSRTNCPVPLARAFREIHACDQVPVIRLNAAEPLYRVYERVAFETVLPPQDGSLTCVWRRASLVCNFLAGGAVEIAYTPTQPAPLDLCTARIRARLNPFIERLNCAIERDDTYPLFHEIDHVVNMKCVLEFDSPAAGICARASSKNVAREINRCGSALRMRQLGLTQAEAEAVLAGEPAQPLLFRAEGERAFVDNVDNIRYFSFLRRGSAAAPGPEPVVSGEELALVSFNDPTAVVEDSEEVFDFEFRDDGYEVVRLAVAAVGAGDLPAGIRAFIGDTTVYRGPETGFMAAISRAVGADLRALLEQGDSRWFNAYPHARDRFATQTAHPLLRSSPRDNFVRHLRGDPDHTYLWDMVCLPGLFPDGFNLVIFTGECTQTADLVHRRGFQFDPARKTIVLWQREGRYALLRTPASALFSFSDYEFLIKIKKLAPPLKRAPLTCDALVRNLEKSNYEFQYGVEHRGKIVGVVAALAGRACLVPCFPNETRTNLPGLTVKAKLVPKLGYAETVDFLQRAACDLRILCRPKRWVQGTGGACVGLLTEMNQFVPCKSTPFPKLPAVAAHELKYGVCDYESTLYLVLRDAFRAEFADPTAADTRGAVSAAVDRVAEWVDALPPELLTYPRYVNRRVLIPKQFRAKFIHALADELPLHKSVFINGVEHAVCENELLY